MKRLLLIVMLSIIAVPCLHADLILVNQSGTGDYTTIQAAINAANSGDSIYVAEGVYYENLMLDSDDNNLRLYGGFNESTWARNIEANRTIVNGNGPANMFTIRLNQVSDIVISGFYVTNAQRIIGVYPAANVLIENNFIYYATGSNYTSGIDIESISGFSTQNITIRRNVIYNIIGSGWRGCGIRTCYHQPYSPQNIHIINNTIYNTSQDGILVGVYPVYGAIVKNNIVSNIGDTGIEFNNINLGHSDYNCLYNCAEYYTGHSAYFNGGSNDIITDPQFVSVATDNFHLLAGSACINSGDPDTDGDGLTWEVDGHDRDLDQTRHDMGALAYYFAPSPYYEYFTKANFMSSPEQKRSIACAWGDCDNDGFDDLFIANAGGDNNTLYINHGEPPFEKLLDDPVVMDGSNSQGGTWGDYNNDGYLDLFVSNGNGENNILYKNTDGILNPEDLPPLTSDGGNSTGAAWGDYDNDGFIDLFVANQGEDNFLYKNNGNGTFTKIQTGLVVTQGGASTGGSWCDFDLDGDLDLFVANTALQSNFLYENNGDGTFASITSGAIVEDGFESYGGSWGDYNNDGYPDLYVPSSGQNNCLYRNNGYGSFVRITSGDLVNDDFRSKSSGWGDVNKDGRLDLFVSNSDAESKIYLNLGGGLFTGHSVCEKITAYGGGWCDFNSDGNLDLFLTHWGAANVLLGNTYDDNNWLKVKCIGTESNTSGIGAKVRIVVNDVSQMREISSQTGFGGQNSLIAFFGIGSATSIDQVRVLWPSGVVSEMNNVDVNQLLVITEIDPTPNQPPIAHNDSLIIYQDSTVVIHVLSNDTDPDGDDLSILSVDLIDAVGSAQIDPGDTTITYTPPAGYIGDDSLNYVLSDGQGGLDTAKVFIEVMSSNHPPIAINDTLSIPQNTLATIFVLDNDTDPDGDDLSIQKIDNINAPGVVIINSGDTVITYMPTLGFSGNASFDYIITDHRDGLDTATVFVYVLIGNRPPVALNDTLSIKQDSMVTIYPLSNDSDPDGDPLYIENILDDGVSGMVVANSGDTSMAYIPPAGWNGETTFDYVVSDGNGGLDTATVFITVTPVSAVMDQIVPTSFALHQNFPNPFNPETTISYALPEKSHVTLRVFSIIGSEICTLVNGEKSAGQYEAIWNAQDRFGQPVSSGIYFYQLKAGDYSEIRKMLLVR